MWAVSTYFQCDELKATISPFLQGFLTTVKCLSHLRNQRFPIRCSTEIEYLARHFNDSRHHPELEDLPLSILDAILSDTGLSVEERDLFDFVTKVVWKRQSETTGFRSLFAHVVFEEADPESMKHFLETVPGEEIGGALWAALAMRLEHPVVVDG
jgi:hypothetical protein